jgi:hypothetical protein
MKLYSTSSPDHSIRFHAGKTEAKRAARTIVAGDKGSSIDVTEHTVVPGKAGIVALANSCEGAFTNEVIICTIKYRGGSKKAVDTDTNPWD